MLYSHCLIVNQESLACSDDLQEQLQCVEHAEEMYGHGEYTCSSTLMAYFRGNAVDESKDAVICGLAMQWPVLSFKYHLNPSLL